MSLIDVIQLQADWREEKAAQYPDDPRNEQSARALRSLAQYIESGEARTIAAALEDHVFEDFTFGGEEAKHTLSRYGFGYKTTDATHEEFLDDLWVACMQDAYEYASEHGVDPTEVLLPCELEAAEEGVSLPSYYWERRSHSTEPELEEAVASYREEKR